MSYIILFLIFGIVKVNRQHVLSD